MTKPPKKPPSHKTDPDLELWQRAMQDVKPLGRSKAAPLAPTPRPRVRPRAANVGPEVGPKVALDTFSQRPETELQTQPLDKSWQKRLRRGRMDVDMTLDLHGMTQDHAYRTLMQAMERAIVQQMRVMLVITGKGALKTKNDARDDRPRGVLRKQLPIWLNESRYQNHIFALRPAHPTHGGAGAFYILIRRPRG